MNVLKNDAIVPKHVTKLERDTFYKKIMYVFTANSRDISTILFNSNRNSRKKTDALVAADDFAIICRQLDDDKAGYR